MRIAALVLAALLAPVTASAETPSLLNDIPDDPTPTAADLANARAQNPSAAPSSRILYVNSCLPGNCVVTRSSQNSSITNSSSIAQPASVTLEGYKWGQAHFDDVMECVREKMSMFDVQITTTNPGNVTHYEVMVAGSDADLRPNNPAAAGGVAPYIGCNASIPNGLAFVFASQTSAKTYLCTAIVHEAGHLWGLDHNLDGLDHMSYERLGQEKWWQNSEAQCHDNNGQVRPCTCTSSTANSFRTLRTSFGLAPTLEPTVVTLATPVDGAWVSEGFAMSGDMTGPLDRLNASIFLDGVLTTRVEKTGLIVANAPADITPGPHTVRLQATDYADRTVEVTHNVRVVESCTANADCTDADYECLGGKCLPPADVAGGLGAVCAVREECASGVCGTADGESFCTAACDDRACPDGFYCRGGNAGVCWPGEEPGTDGGDGDGEGGGCSTGGVGGLAGGVLMLGALAFARRRRR